MSIGGPNGAERHEWAILVVSGKAWALTQAGGTNKQAITSSTVTANKWQHICGVFVSPTDRRVFLNGGGKGTDANSRTPVPAYIARQFIGQRAAGDLQRFDGILAECAAWNVALTDEEAKILSNGVSPQKIRPENLLAYAPLYGRSFGMSEPDVIKGNRYYSVGGYGAPHPPMVKEKLGIDPTLWSWLPSAAAGVDWIAPHGRRIHERRFQHLLNR